MTQLVLAVGLWPEMNAAQGDLNPDPLYSWYHFSHPPLAAISATV